MYICAIGHYVTMCYDAVGRIIVALLAANDFASVPCISMLHYSNILFRERSERKFFSRRFIRNVYILYLHMQRNA